MRQYVYISGPITIGDPFVHARNAIDVAERIRARGHLPFVPNLSGLWQMLHPLTHAEWLAYDLGWLERCDVLIRLPGESVGADMEVEAFQSAGKPVFFGLSKFMESSLWWASL